MPNFDNQDKNVTPNVDRGVGPMFENPVVNHGTQEGGGARGKKKFFYFIFPINNYKTCFLKKILTLFLDHESLLLEQQAAMNNVNNEATRWGKFYVLNQVFEPYARYGAHKHDLVIQIKDPSTDYSPVQWLEEAIRQLYIYIKSLFTDNDKIGITFYSNSFRHGPGVLFFKKTRDLNVEDIWRLIFCITQSAD